MYGDVTVPYFDPLPPLAEIGMRNAVVRGAVVVFHHQIAEVFGVETGTPQFFGGFLRKALGHEHCGAERRGAEKNGAKEHGSWKGP